MDKPKTVLKSAAHFFCGTLLSRFSGFFREIGMSYWFGATPLIAGFMMALRISQSVCRLFGESTLLNTFSPHFEELRIESEKKAKTFFENLLFSLSVLLFFLITTLEIGLFAFWKWGFYGADNSQILFLTMVMLPGGFFISLYGLFAALLQSQKKYFVTSVAPIFFNIVLIFAMWLVKDLPSKQAIVYLSIGTIVAYFMQWMATLPSAFFFIKNIAWSEIQLFPKGLLSIVKATTFTIIGVGASQINGIIDSFFARHADLSGPAYLYYAMRLYQLPLALLGISLSSALLPSLSRAFQQKDHSRYHDLLQLSLSRMFLLILPITLSIFAMGQIFVTFTYGRGAFTSNAIIQTTHCLWGYSIGLIPATCTLLLSPAFFARKDFKTPFYASLTAVFVNIILNILLVYILQWGVSAIALATTLATTLHCLFLIIAFSKKIGPLFHKNTLISLGKITICSCIAAVITHHLNSILFNGSIFHSFSQQLLQLIVVGGIFSILFVFYSWVFKIEELFVFFKTKKSSS